MARKKNIQTEENTASFNVDVEILRQAFERHANRALQPFIGQANTPAVQEDIRNVIREELSDLLPPEAPIAEAAEIRSSPIDPTIVEVSIPQSIWYDEPIPAPPIQATAEEVPVIQVRNGDYLYWNAAHNRWFIQGIPEAEQLARRRNGGVGINAPQPALRAPQEPEYINVPIEQQERLTIQARSTAGFPYRPPAQSLTFSGDLYGNTITASSAYTKQAKIAKSAYKKAKEMHFDNLSDQLRINVMKQEFSTLVKSIFDNPENLKTYVSNKKLSKDQAKAIFKNLHRFNINKCPCCRKFDASLLTTPIDMEFEPLIDLARETAKAKAY